MYVYKKIKPYFSPLRFVWHFVHCCCLINDVCGLFDPLEALSLFGIAFLTSSPRFDLKKNFLTLYVVTTMSINNNNNFVLFCLLPLLFEDIMMIQGMNIYQN